jgi:hypothetical protein
MILRCLKIGALALTLLLFSLLLLDYAHRTTPVLAAAPAPGSALFSDPLQITTTATLPPSTTPTEIPTIIPSTTPTEIPTIIPSTTPTEPPTIIPSTTPTEIPTIIPSTTPTEIETVIPDPCSEVMNSLYLTDQNDRRSPNNIFTVLQDVYLHGLFSEPGYVLNYTVTDQRGRNISSGSIRPSEQPFRQLLLENPVEDNYRVTLVLDDDLTLLSNAAQDPCTRVIDFVVIPVVTITPTPTATVTPTATTTPQPKEEEDEPETKIVSIELRVANGKIWGLIVVENPRDGRSVSLGLQYRVPATGLQQAAEDEFTPTGQSTLIAFRDDQTNYSFSFDRPAGTPDNAEYRVAVEGSTGDVGGIDTTSLPVSFDRPPSNPTVAPASPSPAPSPQQSAAPAPVATPPTLGNVQPSPGAQSPQTAAAGGSTQLAGESGTRELLPTTGAGAQRQIPLLLLVALILFAAAFALFRLGVRARRE